MKNDFDVFGQFCTYLEDWKNWYDGEVVGETNYDIAEFAITRKNIIKSMECRNDN